MRAAANLHISCALLLTALRVLECRPKKGKLQFSLSKSPEPLCSPKGQNPDTRMSGWSVMIWGEKHRECRQGCGSGIRRAGKFVSYLSMKRIKSVVLFYNSKRRRAQDYSAAIERRLKSLGTKVQKICVNDPPCAFKTADAAVAVGGDGTVLYAARHVIALGLPVLGINAGGLGFLSGIEQKEFLKNMAVFLRGGFKKFKRSLLAVKVLRRGKKVFGPMPALNDCVIRSHEARAFTLRASFGRQFLSDYFGDGLIISTPSGSTAYNLAASGPIVLPDLEVFLLSPICPHTLTHRPIVLSAAEELRVAVQGGGSGPQLLKLSMDGQETFSLEPGDTVLVRRHPRSLELLAPAGFSYFEVLRRKLSWGER